MKVSSFDIGDHRWLVKIDAISRKERRTLTAWLKPMSDRIVISIDSWPTEHMWIRGGQKDDLTALLIRWA
jgi:hypothetical protein